MHDTQEVEAIVDLRNVQKTYDGANLVVKNLNLRIRQGEFLTMLGPSGSGKTTTLMMLAGFEVASAGEIFLKGRQINRTPPHKRGIGMVFQNYALFPHMTVAENLAFPLKLRSKSKVEITEAVDRALGLVELQGLGSRRPSQLSGGQQQRVALARAIIYRPALILMDEPLGALDKNLRKQMQVEIKHLHERLGTTIVYVTHDQEEALTMSDRVAVFNDGVVQQLAAPVDLYESPENSFVAQFIGENNRLPGVVESIAQDGTCVVRVDSGDTVEAKAVTVFAPRQRTLLSVRPERVEINPQLTGRRMSVLNGRVEEIIYCGDHMRIRMSIAGNSDFIIKIANNTDCNPPNRGDTINIGWPIEQCRALDCESA